MSSRRIPPLLFTRIACAIAAALFAIDMKRSAWLYFRGLPTTAVVTDRREPRNVVITYKFNAEGRERTGSATYDWIELFFLKPPQEGQSLQINYLKDSPGENAPEDWVRVSGLISLLWVGLLLGLAVVAPQPKGKLQRTQKGPCASFSILGPWRIP